MEKLPFDPKSTKDTGKSPTDLRGVWVSPIMCLYAAHHNSRFWRKDRMAVRGTNYHYGPERYADKYLQKICLRWWNVFANHAGWCCCCKEVFQGQTHSIAMCFLSLCHHYSSQHQNRASSDQCLSLHHQVSMVHHCSLLWPRKTGTISLSLLYTKLEEDQLSVIERKPFADEDALRHGNRGGNQQSKLL